MEIGPMRIVLALCLFLAAPAAFGQHSHGEAGGAATAPREAGQSAFAAISEIVAMLEADPQTDWGQVKIDALRAHLVDMDNVMLRASVVTEAVPGGARFSVTGQGAIAQAIRRMAPAHAGMINGINGWKVEAALRSDGAIVTVVGQSADQARILGLGYFGILTLGRHHQPHHLIMATGKR
jgi:hypothetical protein